MALKFLLSFMVLYIVPIITEMHIRCSLLYRFDLEKLNKGAKYAKYCGIVMALITFTAIWLIWEKL